MKKTIDLMYPEEYEPEKTFVVTYDNFRDLDLSVLIPYFRNKNTFEDTTEYLLKLVSSDTRVIKYRNEIIDDLMRNDALFTAINDSLPDLIEIEQSLKQRTESKEDDSRMRLACLGEMQMFLNFVTRLYKIFKSADTRICSEGLTAYKNAVIAFIENNEVEKLKQGVDEVYHSFEMPKSIILGINLNVQLQAVEAGLISVSNEYIMSSKFIDKMLRLDFSNDNTCLSSFVPLDYKSGSMEHNAMNSALLNTYNKVFDKTLRSIGKYVHDYISYGSDLLLGIKDVIFYVNCCNLIKMLRYKNLPMSKPEIADKSERIMQLRNTYNICLGVSNAGLVLNDADIGDNARIQIITGANGGGKTVYGKALGVAQFLFQIGMFVPAESARISPVDRFFTHFNEAEELTQKIGKFEDECARVRKILDETTEYSFVFFNEAFNSTSYSDACIISENVLKILSKIGARGVFVTHFHDLSKNAQKIYNEAGGKSKIGTLVAKTEADGQTRSFKIVPSVSDGKSYAEEIAMRYGLNFNSYFTEKTEIS